LGAFFGPAIVMSTMFVSANYLVDNMLFYGHDTHDMEVNLFSKLHENAIEKLFFYFPQMEKNTKKLRRFVSQNKGGIKT
jgi:hypothetical protein